MIIDGVEYVKKENCDDLPYCIVRTYSAGVFAGYVKSRSGQEAVIVDSRRLWYWDGAASLSQLAMEGVKNPVNCKFPCVVGKTELTQVIEVLHCSENAKNIIKGVPVWEK
jgi:hypothetical protein